MGKSYLKRFALILLLLLPLVDAGEYVKFDNTNYNVIQDKDKLVNDQRYYDMTENRAIEVGYFILNNTFNGTGLFEFELTCTSFRKDEECDFEPECTEARLCIDDGRILINMPNKKSIAGEKKVLFDISTDDLATMGQYEINLSVLYDGEPYDSAVFYINVGPQFVQREPTQTMHSSFYIVMLAGVIFLVLLVVVMVTFARGRE
ncbi:hypothetical protein H6504_04670 [Candidatus Woesearchaeota archaeon]|nr:hypothetical protein [Candidatus Woesearchaeota archaeon]